ncbi:peptidoglycan-associated lipoprotein [Desulfuromonas versatilis]|uniref:Peptidoglycan-associated lipoprotein n=1 Tax=Desulfuromonas versatilis TaxID=2802975 RepID=A0ABM8HYH0_9BACT|nr:peptidoglycan-associated lipoprotein Pal [Desulfuromonas versatilis]BCR07030.1 peptidoglycan-associated lipoprotein [Desulfuromonas versatilis]
MKKGNILRSMLIVAAAALLAAGCAKKPAPGTEMAGEAPVVSESPYQQEVTGISEQAVSEAAVAGQPGYLQGEVAVPGLDRIFFEFDQFTLSEQARATLAQNAAYMKANERVQVRIEGHCDERGSDEYNIALGERRALAALNYLVSLGVPASRLSIISYGEELPLEPGHGESAWSKNRRAEFKALR